MTDQWTIQRTNNTVYRVLKYNPTDCVEDPSTTYLGIFDSFTAAKSEAVRLVRGDISELRVNLKEVMAQKRTDF